MADLGFPLLVVPVVVIGTFLWLAYLCGYFH